jgi:DNA topoisomerase VI subunit B
VTRLERSTFHTSRLLDFCSEKELIAQTGHAKEEWPLVVLKELMDNALDACEEAGVAPEIQVKVDGLGIEVTDNGPGIPEETVDGVLDFSIRVSSREAYVAPDRGAQGNALMTLVAMPFVLDGEQGRFEIEARGVRHEITVSVDRIRQEPRITHERHPSDVRNGTRMRLFWPQSARSLLDAAKVGFLQVALEFTFLNPHLTLDTDWLGEGQRLLAVDPGRAKWSPSNPTSPWWYRPEDFERLLAAYVDHDARRGRDRTVREVVSEFRGLAGTAKQKAVLDATGLARTKLAELVDGNQFDAGALGHLLAVMRENSKLVKPEALGIIGKEHLQRRFALYGQEESFEYRRAVGLDDGVPWVVEAAFAYCPQFAGRYVPSGVNWSPGIRNPFRVLGTDWYARSLDSVLEQQRIGRYQPVLAFLHMARARVDYTDRGKSSVVIDDRTLSSAITDAIVGVTARWAKQVKAEEKDAKARARRERLWKEPAANFQSAMDTVVPDAYMKASANGTLPARARLVMYAARPKLQEIVGKQLDDDYFTQTLLPDFIAKNSDLCAEWQVVYEARGHYREPHGGCSIELGSEIPSSCSRSWRPLRT